MKAHCLVALLSIAQVVVIHVNGRKARGKGYYPAESFPKYPPRTDLCQTLQPRPNTSADTNKVPQPNQSHEPNLPSKPNQPNQQIQPSEPSQSTEPNEQPEPSQATQANPTPEQEKKRGFIRRGLHKIRSWFPLS